MTDRSIACMLVTHLPVKAEVRRYPHLRGKPVIITESYGSKDLVLDSSAEARGVIAGMPLSEAMARCKDASLIQADAPYYNGTFDKLIKALELRGPVVERDGLGCAYVGLEGLELMYGGEARMIASLLQAAPAEFNPRVGVAGGKFPAYVAAVTTKGGRATRVPRDSAGMAAFLNGLSIGLLPLSWANKTRLHRFGIHTLDQLSALAGRRGPGPVGGRGTAGLAAGRRSGQQPANPPPDATGRGGIFDFPVAHHHLDSHPDGPGHAVGPRLCPAGDRRPLRPHRHHRKPGIPAAALGETFRVQRSVGQPGNRALFALKSRLDSVTLPGPLEDMKLTLAGFTGESGIQTNLFLRMSASRNS